MTMKMMMTTIIDKIMSYTRFTLYGTNIKITATSVFISCI